MRRTLLAFTLLAAACADPVDKAAKQRIFSPEDPPQVIASASEKLPPERVAQDPRVARRVLGMSAAEAVERLGPHQHTARLSFEWTGGGRSTRLDETRSLLSGKGGVAGSFHGVIENSRDQGLEVLRVNGAVFARGRYGKFRQRLRDRGMAERMREEVHGALRDVDALFQGRLKLADKGTLSHEGRTAWRYEVVLGPPHPADEELAHLPAALSPKGGVDATTRRRLQFLEKREPKSLSGEVLVDAATSVVLKARVDGRMSMQGEGGPANLRLVLESAVKDVGQDPKLQPPEDFYADADKPSGIADALDRFGIPRGDRKDGGVAPPVPAPADEPEDE